jgi:DMSO reductase anchor subunit
MDIQWPLVFFTLLTGLGVGAFVFVAISEWLGKAEQTLLPGAITALVAIVAGGIASVFHLGHPERFFNALGHFSSGITQEMTLVGLTGLMILVYIVVTSLGYSAQARKIVATIGLVLAVLLAFAMGTTYILPARPAWNTWLFPLLYVASAAVLGLFTMYIWTVVREEEEGTVMAVNRATVIALAVEAVLVAIYLIYLAAAPFQNPLRSPGRLLAGDLAPIFWLGLVVVGILIPLALTAWFLTAKKKTFSPLGVAVAGLACVLVGGGATRALTYILGSSVEQFF